jgi:NTP pyrophosphatase (non-canonical NTP hydrolase)
MDGRILYDRTKKVDEEVMIKHGISMAGPPSPAWDDLTPEVQEAWTMCADGLLDINDLAQEIHIMCREKGFYDREEIKVNSPFTGHHTPETVENPSLPAEKLALMVEEIGEAVKALRKGDAQNEAEEMADLMIRALDYCAWRGISAYDSILSKLAINADRPRLHGEDRVF